MTVEFKSGYEIAFKELRNLVLPKPLRTLVWIIFIAFFLFVIFITFTPWIQTAFGEGVITTFQPNQRPQHVTAPVKGRLKEWKVHEGSIVKKDQLLVEIVDNDPLYIERLELELKASLQKVKVAKMASQTALKDYHRRELMFKEGLASQLELERAKNNYNDYLSKEAIAVAEMTKVQTSRSRQDTQFIKAPGNGTLIQMRSGDTATFVKEGDVIATFIPSESSPAAEIFVKGIDAALIYPGAPVRLQFEGWPSIQISGWPSVSIGSFGGLVKTIDPVASTNGLFRVLIVKDPAEKWPNSNFLRFGSRTRGWVLLNKVRIGYEWWRLINSFPPLPPKNRQNYYILQDYSAVDYK